jgi:hypothetical protein
MYVKKSSIQFIIFADAKPDEHRPVPRGDCPQERAARLQGRPQAPLRPRVARLPGQVQRAGALQAQAGQGGGHDPRRVNRRGDCRGPGEGAEISADRHRRLPHQGQRDPDQEGDGALAAPTRLLSGTN